MKLLIASDLHGSAYNCRLLLDAFQREKADRLLLLGDLLYHGPRNPLPQEYDPMSVAVLLNSIADKIICVRGNCDSEVDQAILTFPILADYAFVALNGINLFATHGHLYGPDTPPPLHSWDFLVGGHIHLPVHQHRSRFSYINPGSVSLPKQDTPRSYMTYDVRNQFLWHELETGNLFKPLY